MTSTAYSSELLRSHDAKHRSVHTSLSYSNVLVGVACVVLGVLVGNYVHPLPVSDAGVGQAGPSSSGPWTVTTVVKNTDYVTASDFHMCLTNSTTPADEDFASWVSDGSAARKRDELKLKNLFHPIGTTRINDEDVKIYDVEPTLPEGDQEDGDPATSARADVEDLKGNAQEICENPLSKIIVQGGLKNTSKACAPKLEDQTSDVHTAFEECVTTVTTGIQGLNDYSTWQSQRFTLKTDRSNLLELWRKRQLAGQAYDNAFADWLSVYNDAVGSCTFADSYQKYSRQVKDKFVDELNDRRKKIEDFCSLPSQKPFDVNTAVIRTDSAAKLGDSDDGGLCHSILESIDGLTSSTSSEHAGRANCLEFFCEKLADVEPQKEGVLKTMKDAYDAADTAYGAAKTKFEADFSAYTAYENAIKTNQRMIEKTIEDAERNDNTTQTAMSKLLVTAACAPSSICCQAPEVIPEICGRHENGEVALFEPSVSFDDIKGIELYEFTSFTFTTCGKSGRYGPSYQQCQSAYNGKSEGNWISNGEFFSIPYYAQGIQVWTVPKSGIYKFEVVGASPRKEAKSESGIENFSGGGGAKLTASFRLEKGQKLKMLVGQVPASCEGGKCSYPKVVGGAGGTFVATEDGPLIVAGGGGSFARMKPSNDNQGTSGRFAGNALAFARFGNDGASCTEKEYLNEAAKARGYNCRMKGGTNGGGGEGCTYGGGGGGYYTDGTYGWNSAQSFTNGGVGGKGMYADGGFGGGGGVSSPNGAGGGGGYSGGSAGYNSMFRSAGGGGSFISDSVVEVIEKPTYMYPNYRQWPGYSYNYPEHAGYITITRMKKK
jgi:hypothetical protein